MKNNSIFVFGICMLVLLGCSEKVELEGLQKFAATEQYPDDVFLDTVSNKKALIIVAHDDDDCGMSGTIAKLTAKGWAIKQLSLQSHVLPQTGQNPAHIICQGNELILADRLYRKGLDTMQQPYYPIPYAAIKEQFLMDKVANAIMAKVGSFGPSVVFTLDNEKGGYGHPEHIFISQLVKTLFDEGNIHIDRIYQSVYTKHMEEEIVNKWLDNKLKEWKQPNLGVIANKLYGIHGMPEPNVQVSMAEAAEAKMAYLRTYDENVRKNIRKFIPYYERFDAATYFGVFDREFFRVLYPATKADQHN